MIGDVVARDRQHQRAALVARDPPHIAARCRRPSPSPSSSPGSGDGSRAPIASAARLRISSEMAGWTSASACMSWRRKQAIRVPFDTASSEKQGSEAVRPRKSPRTSRSMIWRWPLARTEYLRTAPDSTQPIRPPATTVPHGWLRRHSESRAAIRNASAAGASAPGLSGLSSLRKSRMALD